MCTAENEWTGGLLETNNGTHRTSVFLSRFMRYVTETTSTPNINFTHFSCSLKTECCAYDGLAAAVELKTVMLEAGDRFEGGHVAGHASYDLVKEVRKMVSTDNK